MEVDALPRNRSHQAVLLPLGVGYYACCLGLMKAEARNFTYFRAVFSHSELTIPKPIWNKLTTNL